MMPPRCAPAVLLLMALGAMRAPAQSTSYRVSAVEEGSWYRLNEATPFNEGNLILPQPGWGHIGTAGLALSSGVLSTSLGLTARSDDISVPAYDFAVRELALETSLGESADLLVGKKILKWGTGYAFNPTGVVEPQRSPSDPTDRLNQNDGRNLVSLTLFLGKSSLTAVYLNDVRYAHSALRWGTNELALRAYTFLAGLDLSLVGHYREGDRLEIGANSSYVIGDNLELHAEALGKQGTSQWYHPIITSDQPVRMFDAFPYTPLYADAKRIFMKLLLGGQFTFEDGINVALEYYHNEEGLGVGEWKRWMNFVKFQDAIQRGATAVPPELAAQSRVNLLWSLMTLSPRGTMKDYLFARGAYAEENWSCEMICFINANDGSIVAIPTVTWKAAASVSFYLRSALYAGREGSEFGSLFTTAQMTLGCGVQL